MPRRLAAIVGATGTGKSAIALDLARRLGGEIVNADSRQVYHGMDIGTAKPSAADRASVPHHLYDIADPRDGYSLAAYQRDAREVLDEIWGRGDRPWLVGGTAQYVWGLLENWQVPEVAPDAALRDQLEKYARIHGWEALHARLAAVDPVAAARIDGRNVRRVVRAMEVYEKSGRPISDWQRKAPPDFDFQIFGIDVERDVLYERVDRRVDGMFAGGLVDEVRALLDSGVPPTAPPMSSIGYAEVVRYLAGETSLDEAVAKTKIATHRLIRSQDQWFRRDDPRITWVRDAPGIEPLAVAFAARPGEETP